MRLATLIKAYVTLFVIGVIAAFLIAPAGWISVLRIAIAPATTTGTVTKVEDRQKVDFQFLVDGKTYGGTYRDGQGGNPSTAQAKPGDSVHVEYANGSPEDSCGCYLRSELAHTSLPYLGFFALALAAMVTGIGFGIEQLRKGRAF
jgi:hypothetical protein